MTNNDPTMTPTTFTHPTAELCWTGNCPRCNQPCTWFQKPSEPFPRPKCQQCHRAVSTAMPADSISPVRSSTVEGETT